MQQVKKMLGMGEKLGPKVLFDIGVGKCEQVSRSPAPARTSGLDGTSKRHVCLIVAVDVHCPEGTP